MYIAPNPVTAQCGVDITAATISKHWIALIKELSIFDYSKNSIPLHILPTTVPLGPSFNKSLAQVWDSSNQWTDCGQDVYPNLRVWEKQGADIFIFYNKKKGCDTES